MNIFSCNFEIRSSHNVNQIEFSGESSIVLDEKFNLICPYGNQDTNITVENTDKNTIKIAVSSISIADKGEQVKYLEKIAILLSSILGFKEKNPFYGTPFITLDLRSFHSRVEGTSSGTTLQLRDSLSFKLTSHVKFSDFDFSSIQDTELLSHYYNGLRAESGKSKFFHFFLILEILEGSDLYKRKFPAGTLFDEDQKAKIQELAEKFSGAQKSSLLSCLSRTEKFRNEKLLSIINQLGITEINSFTGQRILDQSTIKNITDARNKLFHKSESFNDDLLNCTLFPLVTQVVEKVLKDPECIL
ncbi:TPA: hypothetical protein RUZ19_003372 [Vibrio cholerae]|uniref:hypothetical protein n=1 Tax=Vibrio cholerae TaxID=666 RepID=UPI001B83BADC|nr:hypothetical protein [Vibrio cholerae]HBK7236339.1 hypothetical protein [Vibrio cholerae]HBK7239983.1 hypothetical protein [Vibrio cholerae]HDZ9256234.1 hypothetical protein [Vibrio cholerae]